MKSIELENIYNIKLSKEEVELILRSLKESETKAINYKAYTEDERIKRESSLDLDKYKKIENTIKEQCKLNQ